ncbi:dihydropteroate synthase [Variovorax sp. PCZ-1]|uniref:dihydropteroate synthase n=1 Tax=Variovorax sp. PCZ-1 TaxID=2835533 RepID=UPI001BCD3D49|nr:dihydropteroate synthase [Variovorax sp. PCZ-1]MBS7806338.1 dihydropteroate synthase [Variovorax sp. PCZ-1]
MIWQTTRFKIDLTQPKLMGIVNLTPDSFSDGGQFDSTFSALKHVEQLIKDGADILDLGAESSRPGAPPVSLEDELARLIPVLKEALKLGVPISVDTYKPQVMQAALDEGADIINDIWGFRRADAGVKAAQVVMDHGRCGLVMMHMHRDPQTMQLDPLPESEDVVARVRNDLLSFYEHLAQIPYGEKASFDLKTRLLIDPGIGFGKTVAQNFSLLARQRELLELGFPLLAGWSRKSSLGAVTGLQDAKDRVIPSVAAALLALERGASVLRVHDVRETAQALAVWQATCKQDAF